MADIQGFCRDEFLRVREAFGGSNGHGKRAMSIVRAALSVSA